MTEKCADCGTELERIRFVREATAAEMQYMADGRTVHRDALCEPCWNAAFEKKYGHPYKVGSEAPDAS